MDRDKLIQEIQKLQNWLEEHEPTEENYTYVMDKMVKLSKALMDLDEACDKQLERQDRLELERYKIDREYELKTRELDLKNGIEAMKLEDNSVEAAARRRAEKRQAWWELIKIGLSIGGSAALIIITGHTEQTVILGQHKWSLIPKPKI